jgi:hypothetical protein
MFGVAGVTGVAGVAGVVCGVVLVAVLPFIAGNEIEAAGPLKGMRPQRTPGPSASAMHG